MNGLLEQDEFLYICGTGTVLELRQWIESKPHFKINQADFATGDCGIHFAAQSEVESCEKIELLIDSGANPSVKNNAAETPSHNAAKSGNLEALKLLVERGGLSGLLMGNCLPKEQKSRLSRQTSHSKWIWATSQLQQSARSCISQASQVRELYDKLIFALNLFECVSP